MPTLAALAQFVGGRLVGNGDLEISGAATLRDARCGDVTFVNHAGLLPRYRESLASAVIVPDGLAVDDRPAIVVADPEAAFASMVGHFRAAPPAARVGVSPRAHVAPTAQVDPSAEIHPGAVIYDGVIIAAGVTIHAQACVMEECRIGAGTTIFPGAVLYERTIVGRRCLIHAAAVLGAYGFGYRQVDGRHALSPQLGHVVIEDDVEIGAGTTIDRGTYGATVIGCGTKLDDQVMIGHNCRIGRHNLLCSQVGIAGSSTTGDYVVMAGQVGVGDHLDIGSHVTIAAQSGVMHPIDGDQRILGSPAIPAQKQLQIYAVQARLPEMRKELHQLQKAVQRLEEAIALRARSAA